MSALRLIPKTDRVLADTAVADLIELHGRSQVIQAIRLAQETLRDELRTPNGHQPDADALLCRAVDLVRESLAVSSRRTLRRAINATGIVLHTGLGRAVLSQAAAAAVAEVASGHSLLEVDAETGERGQRLDHVSPLLRELCGLGDEYDALLVNNNAAAVFLAVSALAADREVIISRGQLVEIGGSFRIPDVIRSAGARLVEVGTTNRVRIDDYAAGITERAALLMRVHPSNFRIIGFTEEPSLAEMVALGRERGIPVLDDLGSGALIDLSRCGLIAEPTVHASVEAGADVITFSGDKLLGGPQAGLAVGRKELIRRMRRHPLMRVLRPDKLTLAAMEATLRLYRDEARALREIPTLAALTATTDVIRARAERLRTALSSLPLDISLEEGKSQVGGGSLPGEELPTILVALRSPSLATVELARRLRVGEPSVWGRIRRDHLLLDLRTVTNAEVDDLSVAISSALA